MAEASVDQQKVFDEVKNGTGHVSLQATAGAGKTFTILYALKAVPRFKKTGFLSFSNAIVNELKERIPSYVKAMTLHSAGCRMIMNRYKGVKVDENKYFKLAINEFDKKDKEVYRNCYIIQDICNLARLTLTSFDTESLEQLCIKYCIENTPEMLLVAEIILTENTKNKFLSSIDFSDMLYFPAMYPKDFVNEKYDYLFLDEAQDNNNCQTELISAMLKPDTGRLIFVGDKNQSIFGFMGSDVDSFQKLQKRFKPTELKLTVTYRCPKEVVKLAQSVYPNDIEAHPDAADGIVRRSDVMEACEGDMIISRNTRPLVSAFFNFIEKDKKSYIVGKDLEKGLIKLADSVMDYSIERVHSNIDRKLKEFIEELKDEGISKPQLHEKYVALSEKCDIISLILSKLSHPLDLQPKIEEIFHPDKEAIRLLTAHRSKGLECKRVFFIETYNGDKLLPSKYAIMPDQKIQENNLLFVIYTRAKEEFVFCDFED